MARKGKVGIDYFSHDVDMMQDKKIKLLKAKHGLIGYAVFLRLLEELYRDGGYYLTIDDDFNILFSDDSNLDYNVYILILNDCINIGLFNINSYNVHNILTSERIQKNYLSATAKRKAVGFIKEYLLVKPLEFYNQEKVNVNIISLNVDINGQNVDINGQNVDIGTQRKGKRKERERKEKEKSTLSIDYKLIQQEFNTICLSLPKCQKITDKRKKSLVTFLKEFTLDELTMVFEKTENSKFLTGNNDNNWTATFDWLIIKGNATKVLEGNYDNKGTGNKSIDVIKEWYDSEAEVY